MVYEGEIDPNCTTGTGDINEVATQTCRSSPVYSLSNNYYSEDRVEATCIFPFMYDDMEINTCLMGGIENFTHPIFRCPVRALKTRGANYISSNDNGDNEVFIGYYCPTNSIGSYADGPHRVYEFNNEGPIYGPNGEYELDPDNNNCAVRLSPFGTCKNNCPGGNFRLFINRRTFLFSVNFPIVSGGFALFAATSLVGTSLGGALTGGAAGLLGWLS